VSMPKTRLSGSFALPILGHPQIMTGRNYHMKPALFVFSLLCATSVIAASPKAAKQVKDQELIQGTWKVTSFHDYGEEMPKQELAKLRVVITEDRVSFGAIGQDPMCVNYTLNSAKKPAEIDTTHELDPGKPFVQLGIYSLEGDTLKLSLTGAGKARPKNFNEKSTSTFILRRIKAPNRKSKP